LFSQITRTTPLRRTILHLGQIFFVDALTFMTSVSFWSLSPGATARIRHAPLLYFDR
jgi:hypothetical protein